MAEKEPKHQDQQQSSQQQHQPQELTPGAIWEQIKVVFFKHHSFSFFGFKTLAGLYFFFGKMIIWKKNEGIDLFFIFWNQKKFESIREELI